MSAFVPIDAADPSGPGTAYTRRPSTCASCAVMSAPDVTGASTTTTAEARAAIVVLRLANVQVRADMEAAYSETSAPLVRMRGTSGRRRPRTVATNTGID